MQPMLTPKGCHPSDAVLNTSNGDALWPQPLLLCCVCGLHLQVQTFHLAVEVRVIRLTHASRSTSVDAQDVSSLPSQPPHRIRGLCGKNVHEQDPPRLALFPRGQDRLQIGEHVLFLVRSRAARHYGQPRCPIRNEAPQPRMHSDTAGLNPKHEFKRRQAVTANRDIRHCHRVGCPPSPCGCVPLLQDYVRGTPHGQSSLLSASCLVHVERTLVKVEHHRVAASGLHRQMADPDNVQPGGLQSLQQHRKRYFPFLVWFSEAHMVLVPPTPQPRVTDDWSICSTALPQACGHVHFE